jgi:hypothetical protein
MIRFFRLLKKSRGAEESRQRGAGSACIRLEPKARKPESPKARPLPDSSSPLLLFKSSIFRWIRPILFAAGATLPLSAATIEGTVTYLRGAPPAVLVWLPQDASWQPATPIIVDQRQETFMPILAVAPPGSAIEIRNSDQQQHNVFSLAPEVDLGLGAPGSSLRLNVTWPNGSVVRHGCKIHPQMQLWVASIASAWHTVMIIPEGTLTAAFQLREVPAGLTTLSLWSPRGEPRTSPIADGDSPIMRRDVTIGSLRLRLAR